jgi:hypothetical protein
VETACVFGSTFTTVGLTGREGAVESEESYVVDGLSVQASSVVGAGSNRFKNNKKIFSAKYIVLSSESVAMAYSLLSCLPCWLFE